MRLSGAEQLGNLQRTPEGHPVASVRVRGFVHTGPSDGIVPCVPDIVVEAKESHARLEWPLVLPPVPESAGIRQPLPIRWCATTTSLKLAK